MISSCGVCSRQRTISTRWRSPTDMLCTSRLRIDRQAVALRDLADARRQLAPASMLLVERERDVLGHRQRLEQREVLEHHADAEPARLGRAARCCTGRPSQSMVPASGRVTP